MKKMTSLALIILSFPVIVNANQDVYCPAQVICQGTPESCYVNNPKNYNGYFVYDLFNRVTNPNGVYNFKLALSSTSESSVSTCKYKNEDTNAESPTIFYNSYEVLADMYAPGSPWYGTKDNLQCTYQNDASKCPFILK